MRPSTLALGFYVLCGALTGWLVAGLVPVGLRTMELHAGDFKLARAADNPVEITDARWCLLPFLFADFDLQMDVELGEGVDLDVLVRQVEPRLVDRQLLPFQGRFAVLRMTTLQDGPPWRSRDEALQAGRGHGVSLAAGRVATVWIEGRGRLLRANVAGKPLPWFTAADEYGMFTLVAKGGKAVLHDLTIKNRGQPRAWLWSRWFWSLLGGVGALGMAAACRAFAVRELATACHAAAMPLLAWLFLGRIDTELGWPDPAAMALALCACLSLLLVWMRTWRSYVLLFAILFVLQRVGPWLGHDDTLVDALFGPNAGNQISEAHGQLVRGPGGLHDVGQAGKCVFLLGGQLLYDRGQPGEHLALLLATELRAATKQAIPVPCLPTADGHARQQSDLFRTFFTGFRPRVLVLGVGRGETARDETTGAPRSSRAQVLAAVESLRAHGRANGSQLVLWAEHDVDPAVLTGLRELQASGLPIAIAEPGDSPASIAKKLAAAIVPLLR